MTFSDSSTASSNPFANSFSFGEKQTQPTLKPQIPSAYGILNSSPSAFGGFGAESNNSTTPSNSNPFAALNSAPATNIFSSNSNAFNFGSTVSNSAPAFSFPSLTSSNTTNPIIPMNFGGPSSGNDGGAGLEMSFAPGSRQISIPKRKRK